MVILAFWTGGQFFIEKQYVLLVFAGIWALMQGVTDVVARLPDPRDRPPDLSAGRGRAAPRGAAGAG